MPLLEEQQPKTQAEESCEMHEFRKTRTWYGPTGVGKLEKAIHEALRILAPSFNALTLQDEKSHFLKLCGEGRAMLLHSYKGLSHAELVEKMVGTDQQVYYTEGVLLRAIKQAAQSGGPYVFILNSVEVNNWSDSLGSLTNGLLNRADPIPIWLESQQEYVVIPTTFYFFCTYDITHKPLSCFHKGSSFELIKPISQFLKPEQLILNLWRLFNSDKSNRLYSLKETQLFELLGVSEEFKMLQDRLYNEIAQRFNTTGVWTIEPFQEYLIDENTFHGLRLDKLLKGINSRISNYLGLEAFIGHKFLETITSLKELNYVFAYQILPRLQQHFLNNPQALLFIFNQENAITTRGFWRMEENQRLVNANSLEVNPLLVKGTFLQEDFENLY